MFDGIFAGGKGETGGVEMRTVLFKSAYAYLWKFPRTERKKNYWTWDNFPLCFTSMFFFSIKVL